MPTKLTHSEVLSRFRLAHGDKYNYSLVEYVNNITKVNIICPKHGTFEQNPESHMRGKGCKKCSCTLKTTEQFVEDAIKVHGETYDYSACKYITARKPVTILCKRHGCFGQRASHHLEGRGCPKCTNLSNTEDFIQKATTVHGDMYDYSLVNYLRSDSSVILICSKHGEFKIRPAYHLHGSGCPACAEKSKGYKKFVEEAASVHGDAYDYSKTNYVSGKKKVLITCPVHGDFEQQARSHLLGRGCPECARLRIAKNKAKTTSMFVDQADKVHRNFYNYANVQYANGGEKVQIVCPIHGLFVQSPDSHLSGNGCPKCAKSGFNPDKVGFFYMYSFLGYLGFGITNYIQKRHRQHAAMFKRNNVDAKMICYFESDGDNILALERYIKRTYVIKNSGLCGFKTEATDIDALDDILSYIKKNASETEAFDGLT